MTGMKGKPTNPTRRDNTLEIRLPDPKLERVARLANKEPAKLERYRACFKGYFLAHTNDPRKLNFESFATNITSAGFVRIGTQNVDVFFTSSAAFLVFVDLPDFGLLKCMFPDIRFIENSSMLESSEGGPPITLIRVEGADLISIMTSSRDDMIEAELSHQRIREVKALISGSEIRFCDPAFDIRDFIKKIDICQDLEDAGGKSYFIALKDDDTPTYTISTDGEGAVCHFVHSGKAYFIKRQELV